MSIVLLLNSLGIFNFYRNFTNSYYVSSAAASSMSALKQPTIRVVAIIAEGVPESDTKQLIAYARSNNKVRIIVNLSVKALTVQMA